MIEKFYTLATKKTETDSYTPVQCVNGDGASIPVTLDEETAKEKILQYLDSEKRMRLEGIVLDITNYIIRGVISKDRLKILE